MDVARGWPYGLSHAFRGQALRFGVRGADAFVCFCAIFLCDILTCAVNLFESEVYSLSCNVCRARKAFRFILQTHAPLSASRVPCRSTHNATTAPTERAAGRVVLVGRAHRMVVRIAWSCARPRRDVCASSTLEGRAAVTSASRGARRTRRYRRTLEHALSLSYGYAVPSIQHLSSLSPSHDSFYARPRLPLQYFRSHGWHQISLSHCSDRKARP